MAANSVASCPASRMSRRYASSGGIDRLGRMENGTAADMVGAALYGGAFHEAGFAAKCHADLVLHFG